MLTERKQKSQATILQDERELSSGMGNFLSYLHSLTTSKYVNEL